MVGFHRIRTTAYHPSSNGLLERAHRTLKTAIIARGQEWIQSLPVVLLGLRTMPNESGYSPFTAVTGSSDHSLQNSFIPPDLFHTTHVWLRRDRVRRSLEAPYTGPFRVLKRADKCFILELLSGAHETVSIDRLKPAYLLQSSFTAPARPSPSPEPVSSPSFGREGHRGPTTSSSKPQPVQDAVVLPLQQPRTRRTVRMKKDPDYIYY
ncbi:uncharacterized protein LOC123504442 [Portunus trituberculatus]|uniref:uncharacterized protein LOC123504442 n=1 Tax=Portunus trituberculatus TaxID=210409 RepID=UPI001E1CBE3F|nr:uncharacterized protein LOC123504442 [Portunus trituberculatus]